MGLAGRENKQEEEFRLEERKEEREETLGTSQQGSHQSATSQPDMKEARK